MKEILEGNCNPLDRLEGGLKDENDDIKDENHFHDAGTVENAVRGGLENWLCVV
jgi:hypothetical protein